MKLECFPACRWLESFLVAAALLGLISCQSLPSRSQFVAALPNELVRSDVAAALKSGSSENKLPQIMSLRGTGRPQAEDGFVSFDGTEFGWKRWGSSRTELVIICVHGLSGAVQDYDYLAKRVADQPYALYSYDLRGMGRDPVEARRGDMKESLAWSEDLLAFDALVRKRHPKTPVVWYGESLGALIMLQTMAKFEERVPPLKGVAMASPIVAVKGKLPQWQYWGFRAAAWMMPHRKVEVLNFADAESRITDSEVGLAAQIERTPWALSSYSLQNLGLFRKLAQDAPKFAESIKAPVLVLHGGKDEFEQPENMGRFLAAMKQVNLRYGYFPEGHHLLLYDEGVKRAVSGKFRSWAADLLEGG